MNQSSLRHLIPTNSALRSVVYSPLGCYWSCLFEQTQLSSGENEKTPKEEGAMFTAYSNLIQAVAHFETLFNQRQLDGTRMILFSNFPDSQKLEKLEKLEELEKQEDGRLNKSVNIQMQIAISPFNNLLHFEVGWKKPFSHFKKNQPFKTCRRWGLSANLMIQSDQGDQTTSYYENQDYQLVVLEYEISGLDLWIRLPTKLGIFSEPDLDRNIYENADKLQKISLTVILPIFEASSLHSFGNGLEQRVIFKNNPSIYQSETGPSFKKDSKNTLFAAVHSFQYAVTYRDQGILISGIWDGPD